MNSQLPYVNKVDIVGNLVNPEVKTLEGGKEVANYAVVVEGQSYTTETGRQKETSYYNMSSFK